MKIASIVARQILDSRGNPTVEADVILENGIIGRGATPSGASTGKHEALELRDNDPKLYQGKSVYKAVKNVNTEILTALKGKQAENQKEVDETMITLDATPNKSRLGANAILAVSIATAKAAAASQKMPLFEYFHELSKKHENLADKNEKLSKPEPPRFVKYQSIPKNLSNEKFILPLPQINIINGGKHGGWSTDIQEYMILPVGAETFSQAVQMATEVFHALGGVLSSEGYRTTVGDEGGYAPHFKKGNEEPLQLIEKAVKKAGYSVGKDILFGIDAASSEFYKNGMYVLKREGKEFSTKEMVEWLVTLTKKYPIVSLEDSLDQEDWDGWSLLTQKIGKNTQIVGDDIFVTNIKFLEKGIQQNSANAILVKLNQIGTVTETLQTVAMARKNDWNSIISHRSGETSDTTIAHLAVGLSTMQIKTGSMSRTDRISKYNELLRIEEILGKNAKYAGGKALI